MKSFTVKPVDRFIISLSVFTLSNLQNFDSLSSKTSTNVASTDSLLSVNKKEYLHNLTNYTCKLIGSKCHTIKSFMGTS